MKTLNILIVLYVFLFSASFTYAQDATLYKTKLEKYITKKHNGRIMTITGICGIAIASGFGLTANSAEENGNTKKSDNLHTISSIFTIAGLALIIPGSINWSIGKTKTKEYQIKLDNAKSGAYFSPNQVGLKLAFKF